jgi:hypothetical protein
MPDISVPQQNPTEIISEHQPTGDYEVEVAGSTIRHDERRTNAAEGPRIRPNVPVRITKHKPGESVYAYAPDGDATVTVRKTSYSVIREATDVVNGITSALTGEEDDTVPPASDDFVHRFDTGVDVNASDAVETITVPKRSDSVTISVDDAAGGFDVSLAFQDGDGNTLTVRDQNNSSDYSGDGSTDVFVTAPIAAQQVEVTITDTSGAANTVDYSIYVR